MVDVLTDDNFILYCAKAYDVRHYTSTDDLYQDLKRIGYIKKLLTRYLEDGELKARLVLNHIITLNNVFGPQATSSILYLKMEELFPLIKPFLIYLSILPDILYNIKVEGLINTEDIPVDENITKALNSNDVL